MFPQFKFTSKEWEVSTYPYIGKLGLYFGQNEDGLRGGMYFFPQSVDEFSAAHAFLKEAAAVEKKAIDVWNGLVELLPGKECVPS